MRIPLKISGGDPATRSGFPVRCGVELPAGALLHGDPVRLTDGAGTPVPCQTEPLLLWPNGSVRSLLVDTQIPRGAEAAGECTLHLGEEAGAPPELPLLLVETPEEIAVCTGVLRFRVRRDRFTLIEQASLGRRDVTGTFLPFKELIAPGSGGDAWALLCESFPVDDQRRRIYGLGGECRASLAPDALQVTVEEAGPLRCALRCEGAFEADCPAGHYAGYRPLRFTLRIHAFAGQPFLRLGLTVVFTLNPRESEVEEIGFRLPFAPPGPHTYRIGMRRELAGALHPGDSWLVSQRDDCHAQVHRRSGERSRVVAEDPRCAGWVALEGAEAGIGVALPWMAEEHPKAFRIPGDGGAVEVYPWRHPDGRRLSLTRFSEEMHWGQGEGIYSDGTGIAKTTECWVLFYTRSEEGPGAQLRQLLEPPHLAVAVPPRADTPAERMLTGYLDWMLRHQELGRWYGFLNFGDMCATWEAETGEWRFHGRWGWCNSEWDPRHAFWEQYRRTREPRLAALAEAFTRHSTDVDTCHWHPFRPYFVGGCYRHSTDHFGDEPCASHTFPDNWLDHYLLTGDRRTRDVLLEAGEFFYRFRWTEDPRFSFSLRSTGNTLRGLVIAWELTREERFLRRAEALFDTVARAQNPDGSWNKRYQVSTPDRIPDQRPYGMATEGTTWAVELGTAPPFTEGEYRELWGGRWRGDRVLPDTEQQGYQTHYLMIGLERLHRTLGSAEVARVYLAAVDWFCGGADTRNLDAAWRHAGCGILCRHLAYAWDLTGEREYLRIGRGIVQRLIAQQNWSFDPRYRGALGMNPTDLSYCFFGVPPLLEALHTLGEEL